MTRRAWLFGAAAGLAALAGAGGALWHDRRRRPEEGWWDRRFATPGGGELALADYRGSMLLINFWATWCPPCVREMPLLDRFQQAQRPRGWQVLGLAIDGPLQVGEFLQRAPVSYPIAIGGADGMRIVRELGNAGGGLPYSVVFDRSGRIVRSHLGELTEAMLAQWARHG